MMLLVMMLTSAQMATAQEAAVYDLVTEVPIVDGGQTSNWGTNGSENYDKLVDGDTSTKYGLQNADPWVEFHYSQAFVPKKYVLWTANDTYSNTHRNPASWTIKAKLNKTDAWTTIATAENSGSNQLPTGNTQSKEYSIVENENAYKYFRFEATRQSNQFQLGELQFKVASAKTEVTWKMYPNSGTTRTVSGYSADFTNTEGNVMRHTWTGNPTSNTWEDNWFTFHKVIDNELQVTFPYLTGKVTKVEINGINFSPAGMSLSVSNGLANLKNGNSNYFESSAASQYRNVTFEGEIDVNTTNYLRFTFAQTTSGEVWNQRFDFNNGSIKVTLVKEQKADLGHTFTSITANGNVLTATCTSNDADHNTLYGGAGHHYTLTLSASDGMANFINPVNASITPSVGDFNEDTQLGATCTVEYAPQGTPQSSSSWTTSAPYVAGNYTARATVRINSTDYVLTANYRVIEGHYITNNHPQQLSVDKTGGAMAGEDVTVTFTPQMGESVATLTVTGDNTNLSLDNGITDNHDNTYTFAMPNENVTLVATFTFPMNADNFAQDGDTYTIKNADGWDYFCQRMRYDATLDGFIGKTVELAANISVTTMAGMVHPFKGTFDGKGKTLTFNRTADAMYTAPFQNTNGATICNLHVEGTITGGVYSYLGGLIGSSEGDLTIRDCHVSTQISTKYDSNTNSSNVGIGGIVGYIHYTTYGQKCQITGCVYDGLIYNPEYSGTTYGCGGFVGCLSESAYIELTDCLFIEGQYDNNGGKHELLWGHDNNKNSTFFHRTNNQGQGTLKNCFFVGTRGLKQGSPAVESATAPTNFAHFGDPTDHCFMQTYGHTMVLGGKYYTPTYGDLVETYDYSGVKSYNIEYDDKPLGIPDITTQLWVPLLRYKRTFTNGKPVTIMLPFNFTKSAFKKSGSSDGLTGHFYEFKGIEDSAPVIDSDFEVTSMTANTPYLYVPDDEPEYWYIDNGGDGLNIFTEGHDGGTKEAAFGDWTLKGTYDWKIWNADATEDYVLDDDGNVALATAGTMVKPTSAYLFKPVVTTYYLVGTMTGWSIDSDYQLLPNTEAEGEYYILNVPLAKGTGIKAVSSEDNSTIKTWFPGGTGNDYIITSNGIYDIYFRPDGNSDWGYYYLYVAKQGVNSADVYFAKEGYATYYNGVFDMTLPDDVIARIVTDSGERLTYQTIAEGNGTVPAGTAVMLYSQAVKTTGTAASRTLTFCDENSAAPVTATNLLHGSDVATRTTGEGKHYKLSYNQQGTDIGWYWGAADGAPFQSGAHKAWLVLSDTSAPSFLGLDGETTKIGTTDYTNLKNSDAWFTLDGRCISVPSGASVNSVLPKGVYIHNGRKQVIK